jgi:predicted lipoprotein with Yx(FWY)xxD motif
MRFGLAIAAALLSGTVVRAQPADLPIPAATTSDYPPGVTVSTVDGTQVYTDSGGHTLYGMDMRTLLRAGADTAKYCQAACNEVWQPLLAPPGSKPDIAFPMGFGDRNRQAAAAAGATTAGSAALPSPPPGTMIQNQKAPDWTIIDGPQGPQWVYKGWHMVFVRKDEVPGSATYDGADEKVWNTLKYVPPVPKVATPVNVSAAFVDGAYAFVQKEGRLLYTGSCAEDCASWQPFPGALASAGVGDWEVDHQADTPQWRYRGKPVFIAQGPDVTDMPEGAAALRP